MNDSGVCPVCGSANSQYFKKINSWLCLDCEAEFNPDAGHSEGEFTHFTGMSEIEELAQRVIADYPAVIGERVELLSKAANYSQKCGILKSIYYATTQLAGLIAVSYYLNDSAAEPDKQIQITMAGISLPMDSTWKELLIHVNSYYASSQTTVFHIPGIQDAIARLSNPDFGYPQALYQSIRYPQYRKTSVLQSGVDIRNAIHHENFPLTEEDFRKIYPYYLDIVFTLLREMNFLDGSRFKFVSRQQDTSLEVLHGAGKDQEPVLGIPQDESDNTGSNVFLYDSFQKCLYPLFPFIITYEELWQDEKEFIFSSLSGKNSNYSGRKSGLIKQNQSGYVAIKHLTGMKKVELNYDFERLTYRVLRELSQQASWETLSNGYTGKKYYPGCYVRPAQISRIVSLFLEGNSTALFITGTSGIGKSALLADITHRALQEEENIIPLFINGRDIEKSKGMDKPILALLRNNLMLKNNIASSEALLIKFNEIMTGDNTIPAGTKILLIIDAVNESYLVTDIFTEIDELIGKTWNHKNHKSRFPWLKVIYSIRSTGYKVLRSRKQKDESIFRNEIPYYKILIEPEKESDRTVMGSEKESDREIKETPVIELLPLQKEEVIEIANLYINEGSIFPLLRSTSGIASLIEKRWNHLKNPLYLRFYLNLLERNGGEEKEIGKHGEQLFAEYYEMLCRDEEIQYLLHTVCKKIIEEVRSASLRLEQLTDIVMKYRELSHNRNNAFYTDPLEKLLSEGIVDKRIQSVAGEAPEELISFNQQYFLEYAIFRYLQDAHGEPTKELLSDLLNSETDFDEYNGGLSLLINQIWNEEKMEIIAGVKLTEGKAARFRQVLADAIFDELESKIETEDDNARIKAIAQDYGLKLELLITKLFEAIENISVLYQISRVLLGPAYFRFREIKGGELLRDRSPEAANKISKKLCEISPDSADYAMALSLSYQFIGQFHRKNGDTKNALAPLRASVRIAKKCRKRNPDSTEYAKRELHAFRAIGKFYAEIGNTESALKSLAASLKVAKFLRRRIPDSEDYIIEESFSVHLIGKIFVSMGETKRALQEFTLSLKIVEDQRKRNPFSHRNLYMVAISKIEIGNIQKSLGDKKGALESFTASLKIWGDLQKLNHNSAEYARYMAISYDNIGNIQKSMGDTKSALESFTASLKIAEDLRNRNPDYADYARDVSISYDNIGNIHKSMGDTKSALESYTASLKISEDLRKRNPDSAVYARDVSISHDNIGDIQESMGDTKSALESFTASLKISEDLRKRNPDSAEYARAVSISYERIGHIQESMGDTKSALESYTAMLKIAEDLRKRNPDSADYARDVVVSYYKLGDNAKLIEALLYMKNRNMHFDPDLQEVYDEYVK